MTTWTVSTPFFLASFSIVDRIASTTDAPISVGVAGGFCPGVVDVMYFEVPSNQSNIKNFHPEALSLSDLRD
jgi:hypothetical protein